MTTYSSEQVRQWNQVLVAHGDFSSRLPAEAGASYPSLKWDANHLVLQAFHFAVAFNSKDQPEKYIIFSRLQIDAATMTVIRFVTRDENPLFPGLPLEVQYQPRTAMQNERVQIKDMLPTTFSEVATSYANGSSAGQNGPLFLEKYGRILPGCLMPYYQALDPDFYAWLQGG